MDDEKKLDCDMNCEGCSGCDEFDDESIIKLTDEETGETFEFVYADNFEFENKTYAVLLTLDDEPEMVIAEEITGEDGEIAIQTLDEDEADPIYDYYDSLLDEYLEDEDQSEE